MELSIFLARAWGLYMIIIGLGLLFNKKGFLSLMKGVDSDSLSVFIAGFFALALGIAQAVGFESWTFDYRGLITIFGWSAFLKGAAIVLIPGYMGNFSKAFVKGSWYTFAAVLCLIFGAFLLYKGFIV